MNFQFQIWRCSRHMFKVSVSAASVVRFYGKQKYIIHQQFQCRLFSESKVIFNLRNDVNNAKKNNEVQNFIEKTHKFRIDTLNRTQKFKTDTLNKTNGLKLKTLRLREDTINKSKEIHKKTIRKSKELQDNIKSIIPPDLHENIYTIPNALTLTRLISAPVIGYLIVHGQVSLALALFVYSCITDFLDGFIARHWNLKSVIGSIIDPLADKMLMFICTISLATTSEIPLYLATLIIGRDLLLGLTAIVIRYISLPTPKTFWRYWNFSIPSAEVHPTMISKINTALQMLYLGSMMIKPVFLLYLSEQFGPDTTELFLQYIQYLEWTVATTTLWSGFSYLFSKNAVTFIKPKNL